MKKLLIALAAVLVTAASYGQGELSFSTKVGTSVDAPVFLGPGTTSGPGPLYTAQLFLSGANGALTPLTPTTTFRAPGTGGAAIADRYVLPVGIIVPGVAAGTEVKVRFAAWQTALGSTYDAAKAANANFTGISPELTVVLGGGLNPPANLVGLGGFTIPGVPEPSTIALGIIGASALLLRRRK